MNILTAPCSKCRAPVWPRVHASLRDATCPSCETNPGKWWELCGLFAPEFSSIPRSLALEGPTTGDLILSVMTGRGWGTRAWLSSAIGPLLQSARPLSLLLSDLQALGHIELSDDGRRWQVRETQWLPDRALKWRQGPAEFAVGHRDASFWHDLRGLRLSNGQQDIPSKVIRS